MTVEPEVAEAVQARLHVIADSSSEEEEGGSRCVQASWGFERDGGTGELPRGGSADRPWGAGTERLADKAVEDAVRKLVSGGRPQALEPLCEKSYWDRLAAEAAPERVSPRASAQPSPLEHQIEQVAQDSRSKLLKRGFCRIQLASGAEADNARVAARLKFLRHLLAKLRERGFPPVFLYVFDETLEVVRDLSLCAAGVMGCTQGDVELERSCFAWALDPRIQSQNFGLPHRDYSYSESVGQGGEPAVVCAWSPLVDTTPENGCLYMVPRALDALWDQPKHPNHMRAAVRADGKALSGGTCHTMELNFNLAGAQPQLLQAGDAVLWCGNTVHWGSACDPDCQSPRQSLGVTFRRCGTKADTENSTGGADAPAWCAGGGIPVDELQSLGTMERLRLVLRSTLLYSQWYDLSKKLPAVTRLVLDERLDPGH